MERNAIRGSLRKKWHSTNLLIEKRVHYLNE
jgi:hypothetical protein